MGKGIGVGNKRQARREAKSERTHGRHDSEGEDSRLAKVLGGLLGFLPWLAADWVSDRPSAGNRWARLPQPRKCPSAEGEAILSKHLIARCHICRERALIFSKQAAWSFLFFFFWVGWAGTGMGGWEEHKGEGTLCMQPWAPRYRRNRKSSGWLQGQSRDLLQPEIDFSLFAGELLFSNFPCAPRGGKRVRQRRIDVWWLCRCLPHLTAPPLRLLQAVCLHTIIWSNYGL